MGRQEAAGACVKALTTRTAQYGAALRDSIAANGTNLDYFAEVSSVAVMDGDKILMGRRRDTGRWTLPGGHLEAGEDPHEGALRELAEEAGIVAQQLNYLGSQGVMCEDGRARMIHAYHLTAKPEHTPKNDPDQEVKRWQWIDTSRGLPARVAGNLHSPRNVCLKLLDIYRSGSVELYVADLFKARSHKYLRKYKGRNGEWVYVYHEGEQHGRQLTPEAVGHIKELADSGHAGAKSLMESVQEHNEAKLKLLRELADTGHQPAHEHLKSLGIDRKAERKDDKRAEAERQILGKDEVRTNLSDEDHAGANKVIEDAIKSAFTHLAGHAASPITVALRNANITQDGVWREVANEKTVAGKLAKLHEAMKKIDAASGAHRSARSEVAQVGGYGSHIYNQAVRGLEREHFLPSTTHSRTDGSLQGEVPRNMSNQVSLVEKRTQRREQLARETRERGEREARQRQEQADRERAERERQAAEAAAMERELGGSMAMHLSSIMDVGALSPAKIRQLHTTIKTIFGGEGLKKEHWPYDFSEHGLKTKITSVNVGSHSIHFELQVYDAQGQPIMQGWSRRWEKHSDGRPRIENSFMEVRRTARTGVQVGSLINQGQRKLMRSVPGGGTVHVHANIDVGGYNWANQGFSWDSSSATNSFRYRFKQFAAQHGIQLTDDDLQHFKEPVHFAAFDDGKIYVEQVREMPLSSKQKQSGTLTGKPGEHALTADEIRTGRTTRMPMHLGKKFMLHTDWYGTWDSAKNTDASKFADAYYELRERAQKHLNHQYQTIAANTRAGMRGRGMTEEAPRPRVASSAAATATPASLASGHVDRYLQYWRPRREGGNMVLSARRLRTVNSWTTEQIQEFMRRAPLSRPAKARLREMLGGRR